LGPAGSRSWCPSLWMLGRSDRFPWSRCDAIGLRAERLGIEAAEGIAPSLSLMLRQSTSSPPIRGITSPISHGRITQWGRFAFDAGTRNEMSEAGRGPHAPTQLTVPEPASLGADRSRRPRCWIRIFDLSRPSSRPSPRNDKESGLFDGALT